jgi:hypothetical protein
MAKITKIKFNSAAYRQLMSSPEAVADLQGRADRIAAAAGGQPDFEAEASVGRDRAHAFVRTATQEGRRREAEDRALSRAIDAGR